MQDQTEKPIRVAIVGGGCAGMTTAYELSRPEHKGRYEVTVYQQGFRLGGKGASGRGVNDRIEEHGLHIWMGWYENGFRLMRDAYEALERDPETCPITTWQDAFEPEPFLGVMESEEDGSWNYWTALIPPEAGLPGDPYPEGHRWSLAHYLARSASLVGTLMSSLDDPLATAPRPAPTSLAVSIAGILRKLGKHAEIATLTALAQGAAMLSVLAEKLLQRGSLSKEARQAFGAGSSGGAIRLLDAIALHAREQLEDAIATDPGVKRIWTIIDLTVATMRGIVEEGLLFNEAGFDAIDDYDCREWLLKHGASQAAVNSGFVRGLYDLGFSYEDGDPTQPRIAAGQSLRATIRAFFTYRGAFFWRMQAGMGDIVFSPLYEVCQKRGVRFEFFHRLEALRLAADGSRHVEALEFDIQARIQDDAEYRPLVDVKGLPCWPAAPLWDQLVDSTRLQNEGRNFELHWDTRAEERIRLEVGQDFDLVVLAVGGGAIPHVASELVERDPKWRTMVDQVKTVATQAFQVWMQPDMKDLGWTLPPVTVSGFVEPFDTWADMRHLLPYESWKKTPGSLGYFCNALPDTEPVASREDSDYVARQQDRVQQNVVDFLDHHIVHLWPHATRTPGVFRWEALVDEQGEAGDLNAGPDRITTQFWTANINPTDRYVLSLPGSLQHRISPLDESYDNLVVAGDWTAAGFNAGCVESAVMSGLLASHAICLSPPLEEIVGYDHP